MGKGDNLQINNSIMTSSVIRSFSGKVSTGIYGANLEKFLKRYSGVPGGLNK